MFFTCLLADKVAITPPNLEFSYRSFACLSRKAFGMPKSVLAYIHDTATFDCACKAPTEAFLQPVTSANLIEHDGHYVARGMARGIQYMLTEGTRGCPKPQALCLEATSRHVEQRDRLPFIVHRVSFGVLPLTIRAS